MMKFYKEKFLPLKIENTVRITVSQVDRARGCPRNLVVVVSHVKHDL